MAPGFHLPLALLVGLLTSPAGAAGTPAPLDLWRFGAHADVAVVARIDAFEPLEGTDPAEWIAHLRLAEAWGTESGWEPGDSLTVAVRYPLPEGCTLDGLALAALHDHAGSWQWNAGNDALTCLSEDEAPELLSLLAEAWELSPRSPVPRSQYLAFLVRAAQLRRTRAAALDGLLALVAPGTEHEPTAGTLRPLADHFTRGERESIADALVRDPPSGPEVIAALDLFAGTSSRALDAAFTVAIESALDLSPRPDWLRHALVRLGGRLALAPAASSADPRAAWSAISARLGLQSY